ncbi:helix-turn-helix domain-containing protein [Enterococcus sp. AZ103]|uniref:helix-turn-helix domain-containing protein n=1 Tax=Enterococcus sp. AZ103 TaxID=2774628 RepID=UPI003F24B791
MDISKKLKNYRKAQNMTQEELSRKIGVSLKLIKEWESGISAPEDSELQQINNQIIVTDLKLPFYFGKPTSRKPFLILLIIPLLIFAIFIQVNIFVGILSGFLSMIFIYGLGFYDFRRYYDYFIVQKDGITVSKEKELQLFPLISIIKGGLKIRKEEKIQYNDINYMNIFFDSDGFKGYGTSISYRPRQIYTTREVIMLQVYLKTNNEVINLNLDQIFYPDSKERKHILYLFKFFNQKGIPIIDDHKILKAINEGQSFIDSAYKKN